MINEWVSAGQDSKRVTSSAITNWEDNEMVLTFLRPGKELKRIQLDHFPRLARETLGDLVQKVEDILPSGWQSILGDFFDTEFVDDIMDDTPFLYQHPNKVRVKRVQQKMLELYESDTSESRVFQDGKLRDVGFIGFKAKNQAVLKALISHFLAIATVPPREAAIASYRWRGCPVKYRHLLMMQGRLVLAWGEEKGENVRGKRTGALYPFGPVAKKAIILYIAFVREVHLYIMKKYLKIDPGLLGHAVFVSKENTALFQAHNINAVLGEISHKYLGEKLLTIDLRQILSAIFYVHFPDQVLQVTEEGDNEKAVNRSANHGVAIGFGHYGRGNVTSRWMSVKRTTHTFLLYDGYQAFLTLGPVDFAWPRSIKESRLLAPKFNMQEAQKMARDMLAVTYGFSREVDSDSRKKNQKILADLHDTNAFLGQLPVRYNLHIHSSCTEIDPVVFRRKEFQQ